MENKSLLPFLEGLNPVFKKLGLGATFALSTAILFPLGVNHVPMKSMQEIKVLSIQKMGNPHFEQFAENIIDLVNTVSSFADFLLSLDSNIWRTIDLDNVFSLENKVKEYDHLVDNFFSYMNEYHLNFPPLVSKLENLGSKMHQLCNVIQSENYKQQFDHLILSRRYNNQESVGYTFNEEHSFDAFKKALVG